MQVDRPAALVDARRDLVGLAQGSRPQRREAGRHGLDVIDHESEVAGAGGVPFQVRRTTFRCQVLNEFEDVTGLRGLALGQLKLRDAQVGVCIADEGPGVVVVLRLPVPQPQPEPAGIEADTRVEVADDEADVEDRAHCHHNRQTCSASSSWCFATPASASAQRADTA